MDWTERIIAEGADEPFEYPLTIEFTIPFLPPSVNALYDVIYWKRCVQLKPTVLAWKTKAKEIIPAWNAGEGLVQVNITFNYPFYHANKTLRPVDTHNMVKPLIDAIAEKQGWNDKRAKIGSWYSQDSDTPSVHVILSQVTI